MCYNILCKIIGVNWAPPFEGPLRDLTEVNFIFKLLILIFSNNPFKKKYFFKSISFQFFFYYDAFNLFNGLILSFLLIKYFFLST